MNPADFVFFQLFVQPSATSSVTGIPWEKGGEEGKNLSKKKKKTWAKATIEKEITHYIFIFILSFFFFFFGPRI